MHFSRFTPFEIGPGGFQSAIFAKGFGFVDPADWKSSDGALLGGMHFTPDCSWWTAPLAYVGGFTTKVAFAHPRARSTG
jgi:hypothetical protein